MHRPDPLTIVRIERSRPLRKVRVLTVFAALFLAGCAGLWGSRSDHPGEAVRPRAISRQEWESERSHIRYGYPSLRGRFVYRQTYVAAVDPETKNPSWIAFRLDPSAVDDGTATRPEIHADPLMLKGERSEPIDYQGRTQVPGRLLPSVTGRKEAQETETSYLSAYVPMEPSVDASLWPALLSHLRAHGSGQRPVHVIAGPAYLGEPQWIGPSRVQIPSHLFAVAYWGSVADRDLVVAAYIVPNAPYSPVLLDRFAVSVDHIENLTDLDLFPELDDDTESALEGQWPG